MTQEEKAKAYDEALEQAKFYHGNCPSEPERKKLEEMFPVLHESEDEKIRIELLKDIPNVFSYEKAFRYIHWLEKQKEQKPAEWSEEDGAILDSVIRIITQFDDLAHEPTFAGPKWTHPYTKELNFLEKLRNRLFEEND